MPENNKDKQLGCTFGGANHRLKKMIMFNMCQRLNEDNCFVCKEKILTVEEFSIEHKIPWLFNDTDLFWDLSNIAFSHRKCNRPHRTARSNKIERPDGFNWCSSCLRLLAEELFSKHKSKPKGLKDQCKDCCKRLDNRKETRRFKKLTNNSN